MPSRKDLANAIRALSMDAVQQAKSGHPGAPMGLADVAEVLWNDFLKHNPADPGWVDRDRFVLSNGHGSMLLYALLHLTGYDLPIEELKKFRQLHSKTPGHPEKGYAPGVETTTGPLGQGLANAVGMALAEKILATNFNRPGHNIVDHHTYVIVGDGCLMEGISHEVCSLSGTLGLSKLIVIYDDNGISIDGEVHNWFKDDTPARFSAYGWQVLSDIDGHDSEALISAIVAAKADTVHPSLICCKTVIGFGSPNKQGKESCHGAPLGVDEIALTRKQLGWKHPPFEVPRDYYEGWDATDRGTSHQKEWTEKMSLYKSEYPALHKEFERRVKGSLPPDFEAEANRYIASCQLSMQKIASRKASQDALNAYGPILPELLGGSADLAGSNLTLWSGSKPVSSSAGGGNYIHYGVREFGMSAVVNGIALHGGFVNYGGTFLMFMEYARNAVRMAALMKINSIFVYTHDSIGLGEDGPTHQPVEQLTALRATPNLHTWRPCDNTETAVCWKLAIQRTDGPSALIFSRQGLQPMKRSTKQVDEISRGGYILKDCPNPKAIIIATGSEVELAIHASDELAENGIYVRVVSLPCAELFDLQEENYRELVLPSHVTLRVAVEAAHPDFWRKYVGLKGSVVGMDSFGESAPGPVVMESFGFSVKNVVAKVLEILR
ncbi:MAG: transketolase [Cellvibrionales bacterium TMED49]|nr:transketolase [Porticoccaceae bacterium]OUU40637.1 MAG: transketolase [Cellvibrionales bacterium TMED49]